MTGDVCAVCSQPAGQRCASCAVTYYCNRAHQKVDWKRHKKTCRPFKVCSDATLGRHLVATRDIKPGEILLTEAPLVVGPPQLTPPVCLACYKLLTDSDHVTCPAGCGWPLCSESCARSAAHKAECDVTRKIRGDKVVIRNFLLNHPSYQCVTALRCLWCRDSNPGVWAKLSTLESHCEKRKQNGKYEQDRVTVAQFLRRYFKLEDAFTEEDILRICGILEVNGHEVPTTQPCHVAVYDVTSMLEHSCAPNCAKSFTERGDVIVRAARALLRGDHLSISYTDSLWGTASRRHHLAETKYFWCRCVRCSDPSEMGTNYSSVRCRKSSCGGFLLPDNPLFEEGDEHSVTPWRCGECGSVVAGLEVADTVEQVGKKLADMEKGNVQACEQFLTTWNSVLHPNHFYLTDVRLALAQMLGQDARGLPGLADQALTHKMTLCKQLVDLAAVLFTADVRIRGMLCFELHAVIAEQGRRHASSGEIAPSELLTWLVESKRLLEEAIFLLKNEPEVLPEGKIAVQANRNLVDLNVLMQRIHATMGDSPL